MINVGVMLLNTLGTTVGTVSSGKFRLVPGGGGVPAFSRDNIHHLCYPSEKLFQDFRIFDLYNSTHSGSFLDYCLQKLTIL